MCHLKPFNSLETKSPIISVCRRKGNDWEELQKAVGSTLMLTQPASSPAPEQCCPLHGPLGWVFSWWHQPWRTSEQWLQKACSDLASSKWCPLSCRVSGHGISGGTLATGRQPQFLALSSHKHSHCGWCQTKPWPVSFHLEIGYF